MTVFGRVNHLGAEPDTQAYSACSPPYVGRLQCLMWVGCNEYPAKAGRVNRHIAWYTSPYPWSCNVRWFLAEGLACGDQRRRTGSGSAEACSGRCTEQICVYFTLFSNFTLLYSAGLSLCLLHGSGPEGWKTRVHK